jgi:energy-coupling factor transport system substrate-specific component
MLVLIAAFIPVFKLYGRKKPRAREVVLIATMSAIAVIANMVCAYTIPIHAGTAIVIITGIALGPEAGFLTGALSRLICNCFMGQGVWTPWEMAAWGILGGLAGIMFHRAVIVGKLEDKKERRRIDVSEGTKAVLFPVLCIGAMEVLMYLIYLFTAKESDSFIGWRLYMGGLLGIILSVLFHKRKLPVNFITTSVYTFITVFVLYGGIMNLETLFMNNAVFHDTISMDALRVVYIAGAPYDAWHGFGAALCVFLFGDTLIQKLERIKVKYGMYEKKAEA